MVVIEEYMNLNDGQEEAGDSETSELVAASEDPAEDEAVLEEVPGADEAETDPDVEPGPEDVLDTEVDIDVPKSDLIQPEAIDEAAMGVDEQPSLVKGSREGPSVKAVLGWYLFGGAALTCVVLVLTIIGLCWFISERRRRRLKTDAAADQLQETAELPLSKLPDLGSVGVLIQTNIESRASIESLSLTRDSVAYTSNTNYNSQQKLIAD